MGALGRLERPSPLLRWADTAYRSKKNEAFLERGMFKGSIRHRKPNRRVMSERIARANAKRLAVRSAVEHVFAGQKHRMGLFIRTIGVARARIKVGRANLAYNFQRLAWLEVRPHSAKAGRQAAHQPRKTRKRGWIDQPSRPEGRHQTARTPVRPKIAGSSRCPAIAI